VTVAFRVLLDACVLVPYDLSNVLLNLAEQELFHPLWSEEILEETERALVEKLGLTSERAHRRIGRMKEAFPEAMVENYQGLTRAMTCHRKDRHVLAAAVKGGAQVIVTANLKDFPDDSVKPYGVDVSHPDAFLWDQLDLDAVTTVSALEQLVARTSRPSLTVLDLMRRLRLVAPNFAQYVGAQIVRGEPITLAGLPAALVQAEPSEAGGTFTKGEQIDPTDPREAGYGWFVAICNLPEYRTAFDNLCVDPSVWRNPQAIADELENYGFASGVDRAIDAPDDIAFMRFINYVGSVATVFEGGTVKGPLLVLTLLRCEDALWRVFSLGPDYPSARAILG
jgi:predicted nucleic acid-binding protein